MSLKLPRSWDFNLKPDFGKIARSVSMMSSDLTASFNRMHIQNSLEKPVKSGWLKKQRTIVKNWQQKYFALRGQYLYYYKEEEDTKPQGSLFLPRSTVTEVSSNLEDAGKFIFEVTTGASREQNRALSDPYILMANSQSEMEEWVKAIKRAAGCPSGVVFGQRLVDTITYEKKYGRHPVPILMEKCADFIRERGLSEEGIFRLPGQDNLVKQLKEAFDAGERPSFSRDTDVHTVASLFKLYLRELPEPVIPWAQYEDFLTCEKIISTDEEKGHKELMKQISLLPKENYNLLSFICRFLFEVQNNSIINKMGVDNLAMVIGVNLLKPKIEDPVALMRGAPQIQKLMTVMIRYHEKFFPKTNDLPEDTVLQKNEFKNSQIPRSSVGWDAAEEVLSSVQDAPKRQTSDTSGSCGSSVSDEKPTAMENSDSSLKGHMGSWKAIPRKRTQTLPIANTFVQGKLGDKNGHHLQGDLFSSEFWTSPTGRETLLMSSSPGHKRTLSEEFGINRKSTYDNVPCMQGDSRNCLCPSPTDSKTKNREVEWPVKRNLYSLKQGLSSTEAIKANNSLSCTVVDMQKEMEIQNKLLQERVQSLEKENIEVWIKVVKLNEELETERNTRAALEIRLRNVEQSRDDAEKRNKNLEQEIQGFVKAMSEAGNKSQ